MCSANLLSDFKMKNNQFLFIKCVKIFLGSSFIFFCCANILLAQTPRRKTVAKRPAAPGVKLSTSQNDKFKIAAPRLQPDAQAAVLETDFGKIVTELYPKLAPQMVERFKKLIKEGFYDGTIFHRASPSLGIIQCGDPNSKDAEPGNDGFGSSPYPNLSAEFSDVPFERGIIGAARTNDPDSANSQFFIMLKRQSYFDEKYTVFGRVIEGLANAYIISISPNMPNTDRPEDPVEVRRVTLQPRIRFTMNK